MADLRTGDVTLTELAQAGRNHAMPLEALAHDLTPAGLHYLLIHFDIPTIDADTWSLVVDGNVANPLRLTLDDLRSRAAVTLPVTLECAGNGRVLLGPRLESQPWLLEAVGTAAWTGTPLAPILDEAVPLDGSLEAVFTGADHGVQGDVEQDYERGLPLDEARRDEVILAYEMNGRPLPPQHGHPVRLIVPGWYGMTHVKWLRRIRLVTEPFDGFQHVHSYRLQQDDEDPGEPVTRMRPRSLMVPPGYPSFPARERFVPAGPITLTGRAWSGLAPVTRVEVSADGGRTWEDATLAPPVGEFAWRGWTYEWKATPGDHELACRATDETGDRQPDHGAWNLGGFANNGIQRVPVTVLS